MKKESKFWFKRKRYGYGWTPSSWQGWISVFIYLLILIIGAIIVGDDKNKEFNLDELIYLSLVFVSIIPLIVISNKKGPKPKWRWGKKASDNSNEDY